MMKHVASCFNNFMSHFFIWFARIVTGVHPMFAQDYNEEQCIYFANHTSHGDLIVVMAALPSYMRQNLRAVAAADYWNKGKIRSYLAQYVLNLVCIERKKINRHNNPIDTLANLLAEGKSLLIFPEGTRNASSQSLLEFRSGLYQLAKKYPHIKLVPCWIDNMNRILPKGAHFPVPLLCRVQFGSPVYLHDKETKIDFLRRIQDELLKLSPLNDANNKNGSIHDE